MVVVMVVVMMLVMVVMMVMASVMRLGGDGSKSHCRGEGQCGDDSL